MAKLIEDYGLIGDGETAALVSRDGSVDWLCWPRFDSDACFAALLGNGENGFWRIAPCDTQRIERRYQTDTLVLETDFETEGGEIRVTDFMPILDESSALVRIVRGLRGMTRVRSDLVLRFNYGAVEPWFERDGDAVLARVGPDLAVFHSPVPTRNEGNAITAEFSLREGDEMTFLLAYGDARKPPPKPVDPRSALAETQRYWRDWIGRFEKRTDWPEAVRRSLITLKAMIHRASGGIVAAPTTSLPETPGGDRNWDYRFCWLRDSTFMLAALLNAGYQEDAAKWRDWLLGAVAGDPDNMRIAYKVDGSRRLEEWTADWLPGFRWALPVRIGNAAASQFQLDVYGELLDTFHFAVKAGMERSDQQRKLEDAVVRLVEKRWREPDQGLWELRGMPRHYVYSKVSAWVAIDRYVESRLNDSRSDPAVLSRMAELRTRMHEEICREGFDAGIGTFVEYYGGQTIDASLLLLPIVRFLPADDQRITATIAAIERDLVEDGLVRRWKAHHENPEGAFLVCSGWLAECQALQGRRDAARKTFERLLMVRNDLGLLAEEYDLEAGRLAGNFPQALSHLALLQTALALSGPVMPRGGATPDSQI